MVFFWCHTSFALHCLAPVQPLTLYIILFFLLSLFIFFSQIKTVNTILTCARTTLILKDDRVYLKTLSFSHRLLLSLLLTKHTNKFTNTVSLLTGSSDDAQFSPSSSSPSGFDSPSKLYL